MIGRDKMGRFLKGFPTKGSAHRQKQSRTMKKRYKLGLRNPPSCTEYFLKKFPIGTKRKQANKGRRWQRWEVKTGKHRRWAAEHRVVMEKLLDRPLRPEEIVHHKNHDPLDNRPSNLQLVTRSEHSRLHWKTFRKQKWFKEKKWLKNKNKKKFILTPYKGQLIPSLPH